MHRCKLALLAGTSLCLSVGLARAADMPLKAPPPIPVDPWVGLYVGGNVGYSWGRTDSTTSVTPFTHDPQDRVFFFVFPGGANGTSNAKPDGAIGGGQIGYNFRVTPYLLAGIEADLQWSDEKYSGHGGFRGTTSDCTSGDCAYTNGTDITAKLSYFGTARLRAGPESNGLWVYLTGGLAYGKLSIQGANTLALFNNVNQSLVAVYSTPFSYSNVQVGVSVGAGIEGIIAATNFRWRAEYLHIDLGSIGGGNFGSVPIVAVNAGRFTDDIVRVGLSYRITGGP